MLPGVDEEHAEEHLDVIEVGQQGVVPVHACLHDVGLILDHGGLSLRAERKDEATEGALGWRAGQVLIREGESM